MMTTTRALVTRILRPLLKAAEGQPRRGPFHLPLTGGWLPDGTPTNFWQLGLGPTSGERSAVVERCIALYSETAASLPGAHWRRNALGGRTRVTDSALSRVLHRPNDYETASNFVLNLVHSLYREGNAYALALREQRRFEIASLHLTNARLSTPMVAYDGSIFYRLAGNDILSRYIGEQQIIVPQRDVLHVRLHAGDRHPAPLVGETPLLAAMADVALGTAHASQQMAFLANQARPSAVLSTDLMLDKDQVTALRDRWQEQSKGLHQGGTPILTGGLKVQPWATPAKDAQLAELSKMSAERICWSFGVPLQLLGLGGAPFSSTESLLRFWLSTGLGFALNHVEQSFDQLFNLEGAPEEFTEFDTAALLRSDQKDRIEALARGVQVGIYSVNDARNAEDLDAVPFGDMPRTQAQNVPLSAAASIPSAPSAPAMPAADAASIKHQQATVQKDIDAMRARTMRTKREGVHNTKNDVNTRNGAAAPQRTVIRKVKTNAHVVSRN